MIIPLLALLSFILPLVTKTFKKSLPLIALTVLIILIHQVFSLCNIYLFTTTATSSDNLEFHRDAVNFALSFQAYHLNLGAPLFGQIIGTFYRAFGSTSRLLGAEIVIIAFSFTLIMLAKLYTQINKTERGFWLALLLFAFLPSYIVYSSMIMREPFEVLFLMIACYFSYQFLASPFSAIKFLLAAGFAIIAGLFHQALFMYSFVFIALLIVIKLLTLSKLLLKLFWSLLALAIVFAILCCFPPLSHFAANHIIPKIQAALHPILSFRQLSVTAVYQGGSYYHSHLDFSSFFAMIRTFFINYLYYLFAPFPWQINGMKALYACGEGLLRLVMIVLSLYQLFRVERKQRAPYVFLLLIYLSLSFLWSLGTLNYGTSLRHNLTTNWITLLIGAPVLASWLKRLFCKTDSPSKQSTHKAQKSIKP